MYPIKMRNIIQPLIFFCLLSSCIFLEREDDGSYTRDIVFENRCSDSIFVTTTQNWGRLDANVALSVIGRGLALEKDSAGIIKYYFTPRYPDDLQIIVFKKSTFSEYTIDDIVKNNINNGYFVLSFEDLKQHKFNLIYSGNEEIN